MLAWALAEGDCRVSSDGAVVAGCEVSAGDGPSCDVSDVDRPSCDVSDVDRPSCDVSDVDIPGGDVTPSVVVGGPMTEGVSPAEPDGGPGCRRMTPMAAPPSARERRAADTHSARRGARRDEASFPETETARGAAETLGEDAT